MRCESNFDIRGPKLAVNPTGMLRVTGASDPKASMRKMDQLETVKDNLEPPCFPYDLVMHIIRAIMNKR